MFLFFLLGSSRWHAAVRAHLCCGHSSARSTWALLAQYFEQDSANRYVHDFHTIISAILHSCAAGFSYDASADARVTERIWSSTLEHKTRTKKKREREKSTKLKAELAERATRAWANWRFDKLLWFSLLNCLEILAEGVGISWHFDPSWRSSETDEVSKKGIELCTDQGSPFFPVERR